MMHGFTGFSTGNIRGSSCYIPITTLMEAGTRKVSIRSRIWQRMVTLNDQPDFINEQFVSAAEQRIIKAENNAAQSILRI